MKIHRMIRKSGWSLAVVLLGAAALTSVRVPAAQAQAPEVAWYRVIREGQRAGTMPAWQRVGVGYAGTFAFMENFEVDVRPQPGGIVRTLVHDGASRVETAISCTGDRFPRRSMLRATRDGAGQSTIIVATMCSATQPPAPAAPAAR